ncbi:hypothetical protein Sphch_2962 [Sphingobium chlorophenolicum L-1]|uniref:Uncharacterized protein n=1 Tax=Sphingobium chlorophenolicum L-1 TaxID=690566 RepID=F6F2D2_SPHCR|nr:hypothetical protein [Sphingobium chlorophenolicum]AEG50594.1 hypothetical protein Sphch_2962 [Sphingobium chlorophenolicum L-1]
MMDEIDIAYFSTREREEVAKAAEAEARGAHPQMVRLHRDLASRYRAKRLAMRMVG